MIIPESWTNDRVRLKRAGVPVEYRTARTKPEIALAEIDRVTAAGVRFGGVLADAGYGLSAPFRQGLTARNLAWAVGIPRHLKVYPVDVRLIWPVVKRGRQRRRHVPDVLSMPAEDPLSDAKWQPVSWRTGTKGKLKARFAAVRVRTADGPPQRIRDKGQQHLPGDEAWLIGNSPFRRVEMGSLGDAINALYEASGSELSFNFSGADCVAYPVASQSPSFRG